MPSDTGGGGGDGATPSPSNVRGGSVAAAIATFEQAASPSRSPNSSPTLSASTVTAPMPTPPVTPQSTATAPAPAPVPSASHSYAQAERQAFPVDIHEEVDVQDAALEATIDDASSEYESDEDEDPWAILRQSVSLRLKPRLAWKLKKHLGPLGSVDVVCDVTRVRSLRRRRNLRCARKDRATIAANARDPVEAYMRSKTGYTTEGWKLQVKPPDWPPFEPKKKRNVLGKLWNLGRRAIRPWTWWRKVGWTPYDSELEVQSVPLTLVGGVSLSCAATYDYVDRRGALRWHVTAGGPAKSVYVRSAAEGHDDEDGDDNDGDGNPDDESEAGISYGVPYKRRFPPRETGPRRLPLIPVLRHEVRIGFECDFEPPTFEGAAGTAKGHPMEPSTEQVWSLGRTSFSLQRIKVCTHF